MKLSLKPFYIHLLSIVLIISLGIIVYSDSFHCLFHFDDNTSIVNNIAIRDIHHLQNIWNYLPRRFILYYTIAINYQCNGLDVFGYHLFNLGIHIISSIFLWWLVLLTLSTPALKTDRIDKDSFIKEFPNGGAIFTWLTQRNYLERITEKESFLLPVTPIQKNAIEKKYPQEGNKILNYIERTFEKTIGAHANLIALFAGLIFVSHPVQTQAVTYIVQRAACLVTLFYLSSLCFYVYSRLLDDKNSNLMYSRIFYACSILSAIAAMFTKETAITLPLIVLLYEFCFLKPKKKINWAYLIPFLLTIMIIPLTIYQTESLQAQQMRGVQADGPAGISSYHYLLTQFRVIATYLRLLIIPLNQNLDYDYPIFTSILNFQVLSALLLSAILLFLAKLLFSNYRLISFAILWFYLTLLPESSIFPIRDVIFEHRLYLPMAGYCFFLVCGLYYLIGRKSLITMILLLSLILGFNSFLTYQRNKIWNDDLTLWNDTVQKSPQKARPYNNRGNAYLDQNNLNQAIIDLNKAIELKPDYAEAFNNRGSAYYKQGNLTRAMSDYTKAIDLKPDYAEAYTNRSVIYARQRDFTRAMSDYTKTIELKPDYAQAYYNRAVTYYQLKNYDNAWADVHKAEELGADVRADFISALQKASGREN